MEDKAREDFVWDVQQNLSRRRMAMQIADHGQEDDSPMTQRDVDAALRHTALNTSQSVAAAGCEAVAHSNAIKDILERDALNNVQKFARERSAKKKIYIRARLDPERRGELADFMSDFDVEFVESDAHDHCISRAATTCMEAYMDNRVLKLDSLRKDRPIMVKHIGENPEKLISEGNRDHHNCLSYDTAGDPRDAARKGKLVAGLVSLDWGLFKAPQRHLAEQYRRRLANNEDVPEVCGKLAHECDVKAVIVRARNIHDISPRQVAATMARSDAVIGAGIIMYHPCVFLPGVTHGTLPFTQYTFTKFFEKGVEYIRFSGPGDSQDPYTHKWSTYSAWVLGQRRVGFRYNNKWHYYEFVINIAAMDHLVWSMVPIAAQKCSGGRPVIQRKLPQMSNSRVVTVYGWWHEHDNKNFGLLMEPPKEDYLCSRVAHVPATIYNQCIGLLATQKSNFTSEFAMKTLIYKMGKDVDGAPYNTIYLSDLETISFVSACMYEEAYDIRFKMTQTIGTVNGEQLSFRNRFKLPVYERLWKTFCTKQPVYDLEYVDSHGRPRVIAKHRVGRLLSFLNYFAQNNRYNAMMFHPMILSSMSTMVLNESVCNKMYGLQLAMSDCKRKLKDCATEDDVTGVISRAPAFPVTTHAKNVSLVPIHTETFGDNTCIIDAFVACMEERSCETFGYLDVSTRIANSRYLSALPNAKDIIDAMSKDTVMPMSVLHVLSREYGVSIHVKSGKLLQVYGDDMTAIYMSYENEHVKACRLIEPMFPDFVDTLVAGNAYVSEEAFEVAEHVKLVDDRDPESMQFKEYRGLMTRFDHIFQSTDHKQVFDPYGSFCEIPLVRNNFNWSFHTANPSVQHRDVRTLYGVHEYSAMDDAAFVEAARTDPNFRFDALLIHSYQSCAELQTLPKLIQTIRRGGVCAVEMRLDDANTWKFLQEELEESFESVDVVHDRNGNLLSGQVLTVFRGYMRGNGTCDVLDAAKKFLIKRNSFNQYIVSAVRKDPNIDNVYLGAKMHITHRMQRYRLASTVTLLQKADKKYVDPPSLAFMGRTSSNTSLEVDEEESAGVAENRRPAAVLFGVVGRSLKRFGKRTLMRAVVRMPEIADVQRDELAKVGPLSDAVTLVDVWDNVPFGSVHHEALKPTAPTSHDVDEVAAETTDNDGTAENVAVNEETNEPQQIQEPASNASEVVRDDTVAVERQRNLVEEIPGRRMDASDSDDDGRSQADSVAPSPGSSGVPTSTVHVGGNVTIIDPPTRAQRQEYEKAIEEYIDYHKRVRDAIPFLCREKQRLFMTYKHGDVKRAVESSEKDFVVIKGKTLIRPSNTTVTENYSHVWDVNKERLITREVFESQPLEQRYGIVIQELDPYLADKLLLQFRNVKAFVPNRKLNIKTVQAVAGAGKSRRMISEFRSGDLIIVPTIAARREMALRLMRNNPLFATQKRQYDARKFETKEAEDIFVEQLYLPVRTMCSVLMNGVHAKRLWIDEMTMHHRGAIYLAAVVTEATELMCLGDAAQNYCFSRVVHHEFHHHKIDDVYEPTEHMTETYRCSQNVTKLANKFYTSAGVLNGKPFTTKSKEKGEVRMDDYRNANNFKNVVNQYKDRGTLTVLTFTRGDKALLKNLLKKQSIAVHTITEYQGSEADTIILVRTNANNKAVGLYTRSDQIITAITRAKRNFIYLTQAKSDVLADGIRSCRF